MNTQARRSPFTRYSLALLIVLFALTAGGTSTEAQTAGGRPFYMGFTPFPPDYTPQSIGDIYSFIQANSDMIAHHFDGGIPWQQALDGSALPVAVHDDWANRLARTPSSVAVYVAITPLNAQRTGLALRWETAENQPLAGGWATKRFNDPDVMQAYLNYAKRVVSYFHPRFLAVGIEANQLLVQTPEAWSDYKALNSYVYREMKRAYPDLVVFTTIQYEDLRDTAKNPGLQHREVVSLLTSSDLLALSTYKVAEQWNPISASYFDEALSFGKPIAIAEMGATSRNGTLFGHAMTASEATQNAFVDMTLDAAVEHHFVFVVGFFGIDFDVLLARLPPDVQASVGVWVSMGLKRSNGVAKPALARWKTALTLRRP